MLSDHEIIVKERWYIHYYNFVTAEYREIVVPVPDGHFSAIQTSWDGYKLFARIYDGWDGNYLYTSHDKGLTWEVVEIDTPLYTSGLMETDNLGNFYLWDNNIIYISINGGKSWVDITPELRGIDYVHDISKSYDDYLYVATNGQGLFKSRKTKNLGRKGTGPLPATCAISCTSSPTRQDELYPVYRVDL